MANSLIASPAAVNKLGWALDFNPGGNKAGCEVPEKLSLFCRGLSLPSSAIINPPFPVFS